MMVPVAQSASGSSCVEVWLKLPVFDQLTVDPCITRTVAGEKSKSTIEADAA